MILTFRPGGIIEFIYTDELAFLFALGTPKVTRASHVEPCEAGGWTADMSPLCPGLVLGPFPLRQQALDAEIKWIERNYLLKGSV